MRLVVDKLPDFKDECPFAKEFDGKVFSKGDLKTHECLLADKFCNLHETGYTYCEGLIQYGNKGSNNE